MLRVFVYVLGLLVNSGTALFIDGCPMFGCRPSGSFSFYLQTPRDNVTIKWVSDFVLDPVPSALGCVADTVNIVCPSNGPFPKDTGYVCLFNVNGTIRWRDDDLHFPTLPLLDNYGDVTGSDGFNLVYYDADGKQYPTIPCKGLFPPFNMALVGNSFLLLVSESGLIAVTQTNGVPVGTLTLNATFGDVNGTYIPIAQPVVNDERFYVMTEFVPLNDHSIHADNSKNRRLYAIDVQHSITDRITISWHMDFPYTLEQTITVGRGNGEPATRYLREKHLLRLKETVTSANASLIWNRYNGTIYVTTPGRNTDGNNNLFGIHDKGTTGEVRFQTDLHVSCMSMFVSDHCATSSKTEPNDINPVLWTATRHSEIHQVSLQGVSVRVINLDRLFNCSVTMTTKMSLVRNADSDKDILIFGIMLGNRESQSDQSTFIVALDTAVISGAGILLWTVPIPNNMTALGQIAGASGADMQSKDTLIVYAEHPGKAAKIFCIN